MSILKIGNKIINCGGKLLWRTHTPPTPPTEEKYVYLDENHILVNINDTWYEINNSNDVFSQNHYNSGEGQSQSMFNVSSNVPENEEQGWTYCEDEYVPPVYVIKQSYPIQLEVTDGTIASSHTFENASITFDELMQYPREEMFFVYPDKKDIYKGSYTVELNLPDTIRYFEDINFQLYEMPGDNDPDFPNGVPNVNIKIPLMKNTLSELNIWVDNTFVHAVDGTMPAGEIDVSGVLNCEYITIEASGTRSSECVKGYDKWYGYKLIKLGSLGTKGTSIVSNCDVLDLSLCEPTSTPNISSFSGYIGVIIINSNKYLKDAIYAAIQHSTNMKNQYTYSTYDGKPAYIRNDFPI